MLLYYTKAVCAWSCPHKYYLTYGLHYTPKEKPMPMRRGQLVHQIISAGHDAGMLAKGVASARQGLEELKDEDRDLVLSHVNEIWDAMQLQHVVETERVISYTSPQFVWKGKVDSIIQDDSGLWIGEVKTTSLYSSTMQRIYHKSLQPHLYAWIASQEFPKVKGVRMFISSKGKPCAIEDIPMHPRMERIVKSFMWDTYKHIKTFCTQAKNRTECSTFLGECAYYMLCDPPVVVGSDYFKDVVKTFFNHEDPDKHLTGGRNE